MSGFARQIIAASRFNAVPGGFIIQVNNPTGIQDGYLAPYGVPVGTLLPDAGTNARGPECTLSIAPNGEIQARPKGTAGPWEISSRAGGLATFSGTGQCFVIGCQS